MTDVPAYNGQPFIRLHGPRSEYELDPSGQFLKDTVKEGHMRNMGFTVGGYDYFLFHDSMYYKRGGELIDMYPATPTEGHNVPLPDGMIMIPIKRAEAISRATEAMKNAATLLDQAWDASVGDQ